MVRVRRFHKQKMSSSPEFAYSGIHFQTVDGLSDLHFSGGHDEIEKQRQLLG